jgi:hypothetical protein
MARNFYRFYIYAVYVHLLLFIAVVTGWMLNTVLNLTPLRGPYAFSPAPTQQEIMQSVVLAVLTWIIAGTLAGLHYWLIRQDVQHDAAAGASAIRSFFLNYTEAVGIVLAVPMMGFALSSLGLYEGANIVTAVAFAVPALALVALLEWERQRTQVHAGAALVFQRLHLYGVQIILLIMLTFAWFTQIRPLIDGLIFGGRGTLESCRSMGHYACPTYHLGYLAASILWFIAFWLGYGWLTRKDNARIGRFILHGASFAYGVAFVSFGIYIGVKLIILPLFKLSASFKDVLGLNPSYDFVSPLTLGILIVIVYHLWLGGAAKRGLINASVKPLMERAIAAIVLAMFFWSGCISVLYTILQKLFPSSTASSGGLQQFVPTYMYQFPDTTVSDTMSWISAIALIVAGISYIPLEIYLRRRRTIDPSSASAPLGGIVITLLGTGILTSVTGAVITLYLWVTALFGSPANDWQGLTVQRGLADFIIGMIVVGIYLWSALKEGYWFCSSKQPALADAVLSEAPSFQAPSLDVPPPKVPADTVSSDLPPSSAPPPTIEDTPDEP